MTVVDIMRKDDDDASALPDVSLIRTARLPKSW